MIRNETKLLFYLKKKYIKICVHQHHILNMTEKNRLKKLTKINDVRKI